MPLKTDTCLQIRVTTTSSPGTEAGLARPDEAGARAPSLDGPARLGRSKDTFSALRQAHVVDDQPWLDDALNGARQMGLQRHRTA